MFDHDHEPTSFITHALGAIASVIGLVLLVTQAVGTGVPSYIVGSALFGTSLVLLYLASAIYHLVPVNHAWKQRLQIVDHSMIFLLIAGTYTPITLVALQGWVGWTLFGIVWGIACIGIAGKAIEGLRTRIPHIVFVVLYAISGWIALFAIVPLVHLFSGPATALLFTGGGLYTVGIVFYALDKHVPRTKWIGMHEIWHLFVLGGSACHFALIYGYLLP